MKRLYMGVGVDKFYAVIQHDLEFTSRNPFRQITRFASIPLLDNEFMDPEWSNHIFPSHRFENHHMWIKINEL